MDSSFQQPHGYMRPPPPPPPHTADPHHHFHQMPPPPPPPRQPAPPQGPWYSTQFQYHHPSQTPSPPPQWPPPPPPPPHAEHYPPAASYPPPPANPYPYHPNQFHPPPPPAPPPHARPHAPSHQFTPHSHIPQQPYSQEWSNPSWPPNQGYSANKNEEDWAAKARAWADAKAAMESQHQQSHFSPAGRVQEQSHYHDQYQQPVDSRYTDVQNQSHPSTAYQQFSYLDASAQRLSGHSQDAASVSLEKSYTLDGHSYGATDGTSIGDPTVSYEQGNLPTNPSVHQQEVPSSYSSVTGKEAADQIQQPYPVFPTQISSSQEQRHVQPSMQATFASASHSVDPAINLADQPLDFVPRFSRDSDLQMQATYSHHDTSMNNWGAPVAPAASYPPIPSILASGSQHDPSIAAPGHAAPPFGRFPGPGLPPTGPPFALTTGTAVHPTAAFSADPYGVSGVPERPKKASVPNWLREEIKKTVIAASSVEHPKEDIFMEDGIDKSYVKGDETDSKSIDSSKSAEDEEDEEDLAEAARTAAINQEIKRVLTEVLLKVTDELFDEIATKVLIEDDVTAEGGHNAATSNHKASTSPPSSTVPKASAKVLVPVKAKELENDGAIEKSNSSSPGDVLGLGNYGSDADDGDDEIESSSVPAPSKDASYQSMIKKPVEDINDFPVNSSSQLEEQGRSQTNLVDKVVKTSSLQSKTSNGAAIDQLHDDKVTKELNQSNSSQVVSKDNRGNELNAFEQSHDRFNGFSSKDTSGILKSELPGKGVGEEKATDDHPGRESKRRSEKNDRHDRRSEKDFVKEVQVNKAGTDEKGNDSHRRKDERHKRKEKTDYSSEAKERLKEHSSRHGEKSEKSKESESRKRSSHDVKDDKKEAEKSHRSSVIEDTSRRKEHTKDKGEHKSSQKDASNLDRHRRRRSSSVGSRGRTSKDHAVNHSGDSSGEGSDGSKRKLHSRKRDSSPSPVRSKRRQVSRSPHSKRSQRRHSPYSSLDNSRGRRSRSRSPVRRQR